MYKKYLIIPLLFCVLQTWAQPCVRGIFTNPASASNPGRPALANTFNWMIDGFTDEFDIKPINTHYPSPFNQIASPFYIQNSFLNYLRKFDDSDFLPIEGWELIRRDFGYNMNGTERTGNDVRPHIVLYNRYSGILRVLATIPQTEPSEYNGANIELELVDGATGLFRSYEPKLTGLDINTTVTKVSSPVAYPNNKDLFFHADFSTLYDPCTCTNPSGISLDFELLSNSEIFLKGGSTSTDMPITEYDGSGTSITPHNFLSSMITNPTDFSSLGMQTQHNIDYLLDDYNAKAALQAKNAEFVSALGTFGNVLKGAEGVADKIPGGESWKVAFGAGAEMTKTLKTMVGQGAEEELVMPMVTLTESAFSGSLQTATQYPGFNFANPGSSGSDLEPESDYPIYNEVLGPIGFLKVPPVEYQTVAGPVDPVFGPTTDFYFKVKEDVLYALNPALDWNVAESEIYAAVYLKFKRPGTQVPLSKVLQGDIVEDNKLEGIVYDVYRSTLVPLNCIEDFVLHATFLNTTIPSFTNMSVDIKIVCKFKFNSLNRSGGNNSSIQIYTLPATGWEVSANNLSSTYIYYDITDAVYDNLTVPATTWSQNKNVYAWGYINTTGELKTTNNAQARVIAGDIIIAEPGTKVLPNVTLVAKLPFTCSAGIDQATTQEISDFCSGNTYLADAVSGGGRIRSSAEVKAEQIKVEETRISAYPNPSTGDVKFNISIPNNAAVTISITDITGTEIQTIYSNENQKAGLLEIPYTFRSKGIYFYRVKINNTVSTEKLVIH